ncbi:catalase [Tissierella creatinophila]|uniref:Catalase n=1 Tax=Tissierella creatinophila DSM 6911 TaxID=1123403 RepID=A0A1U7M7B7_TISCR|nr:catalase [Tissierella creatinophila]OLS03213.1 catalase HPII [Tissierella creatinophila DSM 6911]
MKDKKDNKPKMDKKQEQLEKFKVRDEGETLTTNTGMKVTEDEKSLTAGRRGPTLLEDFHYREKMMHFDHERIPERVVHARGHGAHGTFTCTKSMKEFTKAIIFSEEGKETPLFMRFSPVAGNKGSSDTVRDVRGFAMKFYTEEGNYDLVGNNMPVFFIQDGIKFPDFIHAVKMEPHHDMPQASSAHDTFWDFISQNHETAHMLMWAMSDRGIPRSTNMMEGFGVHTFRWINEDGKSHFIKYHFKPVLGTHSLVWDEAQKISGKDPDFHRRDLWDSIEKGNYPKWEVGVQLIPEKDEFKYGIDLLDPTKLIPEEMVPITIIGKIELNKNPDNFFAETEQVAFHPGHIIPGIDFTNDPLLQTRLFSYLDTQLSRLGGPNFNEIPINRPIAPVYNNQRDGMHRMTINTGQVSYHKNFLKGNDPHESDDEHDYRHLAQKVEGYKTRERSESFDDHFSQAIMFYNSMSEVEKQHIKDAISFELNKCESEEVRQNTVNMIANIDRDLAKHVAEKLDCKVPNVDVKKPEYISPALSQMNTKFTAKGRKALILLSDSSYEKDAENIIDILKKEGCDAEISMPKISDGNKLKVDWAVDTPDSVLYDSIVVMSDKNPDPMFKKKATDFLNDAFSHYKTIAPLGDSINWMENWKTKEPGVLNKDSLDNIAKEIAKHRHWDRKIVK